jgi:hypothetical protein
MSFIQNFYTSRDNNTDGNTYVGQEGRLWYNPNTNSIYVNTANIAGGTPVALATGANIVANIITVNTITSTGGNITVTGNLVISGNISPATDTKVGGIKAGPGANIANDGTLTIDTANIPLSFGNFTASNNVLSIVNVDEDMILQTEGVAEIQLIGNVGFYKPNGLPPDTANRYAFFNQDGQVTFTVPDTDPLSGAFKIIGSASGNFSPPMNTGVMLQITGQNNDASRLYNDSIGSFAAFVGRRINGTVGSPTAVQAGDEIIRISSTGYTGTEIPGAGTARIVFQAIENYTANARGSNLSFWATAVGSNVLTQVANVTVANGVSATQFNTPGNVTATGNIAGGNLILSTGGIISSTGLISTTGNISAGNVNSYVTLPAGTASQSPLLFSAGNIQIIPPTAGAMSYDGRVFYATPQDAERGLVVTEQVFVLNGNYTLVDQTALQSMFGKSVSLSSNTRYAYRLLGVVYKTTNNISLQYATQGNVVLASHSYQTTTTASSTLATISTPSVLRNVLTTGYGTAVTVSAALNGTGYYSLTVNGVLDVTTGGTWIPEIGFTGSPGAGSYTAASSSIEVWPIGPSGANVSIGNWT